MNHSETKGESLFFLQCLFSPPYWQSFPSCRLAKKTVLKTQIHFQRAGCKEWILRQYIDHWRKAWPKKKKKRIKSLEVGRKESQGSHNMLILELTDCNNQVGPFLFVGYIFSWRCHINVIFSFFFFLIKQGKMMKREISVCQQTWALLCKNLLKKWRLKRESFMVWFSIPVTNYLQCRNISSLGSNYTLFISPSKNQTKAENLSYERRSCSSNLKLSTHISVDIDPKSRSKGTEFDPAIENPINILKVSGHMFANVSTRGQSGLDTEILKAWLIKILT